MVDYNVSRERDEHTGEVVCVVETNSRTLLNLILEVCHTRVVWSLRRVPGWSATRKLPDYAVAIRSPRNEEECDAVRALIGLCGHLLERE